MELLLHDDVRACQCPRNEVLIEKQYAEVPAPFAKLLGKAAHNKLAAQP